MDQFIDNLLTEPLVCDMALPHILNRIKLEEQGKLDPRQSQLDNMNGD
jgi:hypothetical protein